jgi:competence protein ComEC
VLFLAAFDWIWLPLLKALEGSIWLLNKVIAWVASFEGFVFKDIPLSIYIMWGLYGLIFSAVIWFKKPTFKKLLVVFVVTISLQFLAITLKYINQKEAELLIFNCKGASVITKRYGDQVTVYFSNNLPNNNYAKFALNSYLVGNSCDLKAKDSLANLIYFRRKKILVINREGNYFSNVAPDILLLVNNPKINMEKVLQITKPKLVVADGSNYNYYCKLWKATCKKQKIPFHNTAEKGFYKL